MSVISFKMVVYEKTIYRPVKTECSSCSVKKKTRILKSKKYCSKIGVRGYVGGWCRMNDPLNCFSLASLRLYSVGEYLCESYWLHDGKPQECCPRAVARKQLQRLSDMGYKYVTLGVVPDMKC